MAHREPTPEPARRRGVTHVTRVSVESGRGVFMISVAAELAEMHPQTLRMYEARGLIEPKRSPKGTRLYSHEDVDRLHRIQEMTSSLGLNLAGVERVLALEQQLEQMNTRIEQLEVQALHAEVQLAEELEQVRRSFRAELVPHRAGQLVRAADARSPFARTGERPTAPKSPTERRPDGSQPS